MKKQPSLSGAVALACIFQVSMCHATGLIYTPVNPTFGGDPNNGPFLLSTANAVNTHTAPATSGLDGISAQSPLQQFNSELEQAILSRIASSATASIIGPNGTLQPGTITTGQFTVSVTNLGNGSLQVTTTDTSTGQSTSFQVGQ
ncbi:curli assembly protein CsgF [Trinickia mobilis]|uniref:curli assembly protein CsgF n=1 Tax=Trinickia mobilis TaxID=2816356 RepID=UPI001A8DD2FD|nr:curli assembly protein CsgF [Trinickia mobilis]